MPIITSKVDPFPFQDSALAFIEPGVTTRNELVEQFGEPTLSRRDGRLLVYAASVNHARLVLVSIGEFSYDHHYLFIDLDQEQVVQSYEVVRQPDRCRRSGECVMNAPWVHPAAPPWDPLGRDVLPTGLDIAVLTDSDAAAAMARSHLPNDSECSLFLWGVTGDYSSVVAASVDGRAWRTLVYHTRWPDSASARTFIWYRLPSGIHQVLATLYPGPNAHPPKRPREIKQFDVQCEPGARLFAKISTVGGFIRPPRVTFELLTEDNGQRELERSQLVLY